MRVPPLGALVLLAAVLPGCGSDKPSAVRGAPTACFTMTSQPAPDAQCPYDLDFTLDASCSSDDLTPAANLEVRWDFENDGTWDTPFSTTKVYTQFQPDPTRSSWSAKVQVRDADGKTSVKGKTIALGPFPTEPDLVAGPVRFTLGTSVHVNTVHANEEFTVLVYQTCLGSFANYETRILRDGVPVDSMSGSCSGSLYGCGASGRGGWTVSTPGTYQFTAIVDSDGEETETNENNNVAQGTLVVVP